MLYGVGWGREVGGGKLPGQKESAINAVLAQTVQQLVKRLVLAKEITSVNHLYTNNPILMIFEYWKL